MNKSGQMRISKDYSPNALSHTVNDNTKKPKIYLKCIDQVLVNHAERKLCICVGFIWF